MGLTSSCTKCAQLKLLVDRVVPAGSTHTFHMPFPAYCAVISTRQRLSSMLLGCERTSLSSSANLFLVTCEVCVAEYDPRTGA